jgi:HPt (histidine-containing phosphotransfer) domain-containing protein
VLLFTPGAQLPARKCRYFLFEDVNMKKTNSMKSLVTQSNPSYADTGSVAHGDPVDVAELMERVAWDLTLLGHLVEIFFDDYEGCRHAMIAAIQSADPEALQKWAHRVKGALGNFAAHDAYQYASKLEDCSLNGDFELAVRTVSELNSEVDRVKERLTSILTPTS